MAPKTLALMAAILQFTAGVLCLTQNQNLGMNFPFLGIGVYFFGRGVKTLSEALQIT